MKKNYLLNYQVGFYIKNWNYPALLLLFVFLYLFPFSLAIAQETVFWRSEASNANWANTDVNNWWRQGDGWDVRRPDLAFNQWSADGTKSYNIIIFNNAVQLTTTVIGNIGGEKYHVHRLEFRNSSNRVFNASSSGYFALGGGSQNAKIEAISGEGTGNYTINVPITYEKDTEINPVGGSITIGANITNGGFNTNVWGSSDKTLTFTGELSGEGGLQIKSNTTVIITGNSSYTGGTIVEAGTLEIQGNIASSAVTVKNGATLLINGNNVTVASLTVESGAFVQVEVNKALTVTGNLSNSGSLTIKSNASGTGSLIVNGTFTGNITSERYIAGYTSASDGWHLISSPVNNFSIASTILAPGANDDLFWYDETQHLWMNYKEGSFTTFTNGYGYLCAYENTSTKSFSGTPNHSDLTFTNLSRTSNRGYHALGNPFQSALKWNDGNWALTDVNSNAYLLNNGGTYSTISANGIIPSNQGFFVRVLSGTNSVTIPKAARVHDNTPWYKSGNAGLRLSLNAHSTTDHTYVESGFLANESATLGFDEVWDGFYLNGINGAPKMYLMIEGEKLSLNALPEFRGSYEIGFIKGNSDDYRMTFGGFEDLVGTSAVLTDLKTGIVVDVTSAEEYLFSSQSSDPEIRFLVSFDMVGLPESAAKDVKAYSFGGLLYIQSVEKNFRVETFSLTGQKLMDIQTRSTQIPLSVAPGVYIVRITGSNQTHTQKIFVD